MNLLRCFCLLYMVSHIITESKSDMSFFWRRFHYNYLEANPIALKSRYNRYIVTESDDKANANGKLRNLSAIFAVKLLGNFKVALKSNRNKFLHVEANGAVNAIEDSIKPSGVFEMEFLDAMRVALKSQLINKYLVAESDGQLVATGDKKTSSSIFTMIVLESALSLADQKKKYNSLTGTLITIKSSEGRDVVVEKNGDVNANRQFVGKSKILRVETLGNNLITMKSWQNKYVQAIFNGQVDAKESRRSYPAKRLVYTSKLFIISFVNAKQVALKSTPFNMYMVAERRGQLNANRFRRGTRELFTYEVVGHWANGKYSLWSAWTECSKSCGGGTKHRKRECNNPPPSNGGADCTGAAAESKGCNMDPCLDCNIKTGEGAYEDYHYYKLTNKYECYNSCVKYRKDNIEVNGISMYEQKKDCYCVENMSKFRADKFYKTCHLLPVKNEEPPGCAFKPGIGVKDWHDFGSFRHAGSVNSATECVKKCFEKQTKNHNITGVVMKQSLDCYCHKYMRTDEFTSKEDKRWKSCILPPPKLDNGEWSLWGPCSKLCGGGMQSRKRKCSSPCIGAIAESQECNIERCPDCVLVSGQGLGTTYSDSFQPTKAECVNSCIEQRKTNKDINGATMYKFETYCYCVAGFSYKKVRENSRTCKLLADTEAQPGCTFIPGEAILGKGGYYKYINGSQINRAECVRKCLGEKTEDEDINAIQMMEEYKCTCVSMSIDKLKSKGNNRLTSCILPPVKIENEDDLKTIDELEDSSSGTRKNDTATGTEKDDDASGTEKNDTASVTEQGDAASDTEKDDTASKMGKIDDIIPQ